MANQIKMRWPSSRREFAAPRSPALPGRHRNFYITLSRKILQYEGVAIPFMKRNDIRNVAVIAHVDHGKTTLVDQMLRQSGLFRSEGSTSSSADSTASSWTPMTRNGSAASPSWRRNCGIRIGDVKVNLIDTPGHADFGGEVERILKMADGAFVLVDAAEGPLPQTRFVLKRSPPGSSRSSSSTRSIGRTRISATFTR